MKTKMAYLEPPSGGFILAAPRSGTHWVSNVLGAAGVAAGHDGMMGGHKPADMVVDVSSQAIIMIEGGAWPESDTVFLARDPLSVISSMLANAILNPWRKNFRAEIELMMRFSNATWHTSPENMVITVVWKFFDAIYRHQHKHVYRLEDVAINPFDMEAMLSHVNVFLSPDQLRPFMIDEEVPRNHGADTFTLTWNDLPGGRYLDDLRGLAEHLGYKY